MAMSAIIRFLNQFFPELLTLWSMALAKTRTHHNLNSTYKLSTGFSFMSEQKGEGVFEPATRIFNLEL